MDTILETTLYEHHHRLNVFNKTKHLNPISSTFYRRAWWKVSKNGICIGSRSEYPICSIQKAIIIYLNHICSSFL